MLADPQFVNKIGTGKADPLLFGLQSRLPQIGD